LSSSPSSLSSSSSSSSPPSLSEQDRRVSWPSKNSALSNIF
jgi:hypothetical protein